MARAYYSTVFHKPAAEVWKIIRDFNNYPVWVGGAGESAIEEGKSGDTVSAVRSVHYKGRHIRQRLLALSDAERSQTYEFCEEPTLPVTAFRATLHIREIVDGDGAFAECGPISTASRPRATSSARRCAAGSANGSNRCGRPLAAQPPRGTKGSGRPKAVPGRFGALGADIGRINRNPAVA